MLNQLIRILAVILLALPLTAYPAQSGTPSTPPLAVSTAETGSSPGSEAVTDPAAVQQSAPASPAPASPSISPAQTNSSAPAPSAPVNSSSEADLVTLLENVPAASISTYQAKNNLGAVLGPGKVIQNPAGGYLIVHGSRAALLLSSSEGLRTWTFRTELDARSHQGTIMATSDGGFLVAAEHNKILDQPGYLRLLHYPTLEALYAAKAANTFTAPHSLTDCDEGTPHIYRASLNPDIEHSTIEIGFHYNTCDTDRVASGTLVNFSQWSTSIDHDVNNAVIAAADRAGSSIEGNIGDRDSITFGDTQYAVVEAQGKKGDFGTWRVYLYNFSTRQARLLNITTPGGTENFANPAVTALTGPDGSQGIVVTLFIPHERAALGEAGGLLYYVPTSPPAPA